MPSFRCEFGHNAVKLVRVLDPLLQPDQFLLRPLEPLGGLRIPARLRQSSSAW